MFIKNVLFPAHSTKSGSSHVALPGIRQTSEVAFFATQLGWLMTQRAGCWILDNKKSGSACSALTGVRQTGEAALFAAQLGWLMTLIAALYYLFISTI